MSSIDQQFVEFIVKSLVSKPDAVKIERRIDEKGVLLELTVDPEDLGRVIGKRGATAQSLRTLLRALGTKNDARYNLKIIDNGEPYERRPREDEAHDQTRQESEKEDKKPEENNKKEEGKQDPENEQTEESIEEAQPAEEDLPDETPEEEERDHDSVISKTRKELEEFDDLDL
ncbi:MAG TPA: KH domain-containing protein [Patescibacteria group bacterium]|nr:KH domain-containing protein [Patescibacteria group bacterium]